MNKAVMLQMEGKVKAKDSVWLWVVIAMASLLLALVSTWLVSAQFGIEKVALARAVWGGLSAAYFLALRAVWVRLES